MFQRLAEGIFNDPCRGLEIRSHLWFKQDSLFKGSIERRKMGELMISSKKKNQPVVIFESWFQTDPMSHFLRTDRLDEDQNPGLEFRLVKLYLKCQH